ncbi:MAG: hypothetical protein QXQ40_00850 [Candidatus Aenigmatarchaeota archaeon]
MISKTEKRIYSLFANITSSIGYSDIHGRIIALMLAERKPLSLQELSRKTNYSLGSISLSLDLLEFFGLIKKFKRFGDRKVYVKLDGDLLSALRNAVLLKVEKNITEALNEFEKYKKIKDRKTVKTISVLEKEIRRLEKYIKELSKVKIPKR